MFSVADPDHQRAAQAGRDHHVRIVAEQHDQTVGALQLCQRVHDRGEQHVVRADRHVARAACSNASVRHSLIRWAITSLSVADTKTWPGLRQAILQLAKILDHAVVHDRDRLRIVEVRVGIDLRGRAVSRPSRMADADRSIRMVHGRLPSPASRCAPESS